jgi:hypothetical protein
LTERRFTFRASPFRAAAPQVITLRLQQVPTGASILGGNRVF